MPHAALIAEVEDWLVQKALGDPDIVALFQTLCERLGAIGVPVDRASMSWPTLHPMFRAERIVWSREDDARLVQVAHGEELSEEFLRSPFYYVLEKNVPRLRRRLIGPEKLIDFPVLAELSEQGHTDYLLTASRFRIGDVAAVGVMNAGIMASWATKREDGFSGEDATALTRIQRFFAVACRAAIQKRVMTNIATTYLGPTAGAKALAGEIRRGDGETISAVVWYADLRGSTRLSGEMAPEDYLSLLKDYYDCTAQPVIDEGGEILDYIGDAVLAIFPLRDGFGHDEAVRRATEAMGRALALRDERAAKGPETQIRFSISMALGDVMFGNIGVPARLNFSVIGQVVNKVARMDDLSKELAAPVLATTEIAKACPERWISLGPQRLTGVAEPVEIFRRAEAVEATSRRAAGA